MIRYLRTVAAGVVVAAMVVGAPAALVIGGGWPLPDHVPTLDELAWWVSSPVTLSTIADILVCLAWMAWGYAMVCLIVEAIDVGAELAAYRRTAGPRERPSGRDSRPVDGRSSAAAAQPTPRLSGHPHESTSIACRVCVPPAVAHWVPTPPRVRAWLGVNPRTHTHHLPEAVRGGHQAGRYVLSGVLCDADLFSRLRLRAQALTGPDALTCLTTALALVRGAPYADATTHWLTHTHLDHALTAAINDVTTLTTTIQWVRQ